MEIAGATFTILGALDAFPQRLAAREIAARGGSLRRGLSRRTTVAIVGHGLINGGAERIVTRLDQAKAAGARLISENTFLGLLGTAEQPVQARTMSRRMLIEQSGLGADVFDRLVLFDALDFAEEPFEFRDLVAARQYARLLKEGVDWVALVAAIRRCGRAADGSLSGVRLERTGWNAVAIRTGERLATLDGQHILPFAGSEDEDGVDALFAEAEEAESQRDWARAAALYRRCMALDASDPVIPFNLSHVLRQQGEWQEARHCLSRVLKLDPGYAEAWYNLAATARERGDKATARRCLEKAIAADPTYPDPVYNLALSHFEAGEYDEATRLWTRYLDLDPTSDWGEKARQGLKLIAMMANEPRTPPGNRGAPPGPGRLRRV